MSNIVEPGTGVVRVYIIPSARPSIHNHCGCLFAAGERTIMGRYGVMTNSNENNGSDNEQGIDVVDNAFSKHAQPIRPPSRVQNGYRRNSLDQIKSKNNQNNYISDCESDVLSKSVPATLPSQLYYSNTSTSDDEEVNNETRHTNTSYHSIGTPNRSNLSRNASKVSTPRVGSQIICEQENNSIVAKVAILLSIVAALCAVACTRGFNFGQMSIDNSYNEFSFYTDVAGLGEKYNIDENAILQVQTGIDTVFEKQDAGSFIFVYNSMANDFKLREFNKFINDVSYAASKYLRNDSKPLHYTVVDGTRLDMEEHSELLCRYRDQLQNSGVMLVRHLEAIPSDLAMAFHYYCDEYNPLVKKSAIFFTLNLNECPQKSDKISLHTLIEKCLTAKWKGIALDSIGPLLTRVVSVVIDLTSAF